MFSDDAKDYGQYVINKLRFEMPLSDPSKPKVSLASLSATTAAAAESLWSRSKKSSKKRQSSSRSLDSRSASISEAPSSTVNSISVTETTAHSQLPNTHPQPLDRQEFRQRFLEGLQFYCENSSLILNSDLPADLIEFVTAHGFSVESLGIILELKKSSAAFSDKKTLPPNTSVLGVHPTGDKLTREQNFSEISRRLLQHWMSADSCAEAFVSLSLGEEIPGLIAECASFQRILFAVPENFHIAGKDFLNFLLSQVILAINALSFGVKLSSSTDSGTDDGYQLKIRTQTLASGLDRIFARHFSDAEYFYTATDDETYFEDLESNPFLKFIGELVTLCERDVIARRLVSKILLQFSSHSAFKFAKALFCYSPCEESSAASTLLYPATEFLERSSQWKHILQSLPVKTVTKSKRLWLNWAVYIEKESKCCDKFWKNCVEHWIILNKSPLVDEHPLFSATLALTALARQIKRNRIIDDNEETSEFLVKLDPGNILQNVTYSLEGIGESKRVCGMALAEVVADLQFTLRTLKGEQDIPQKLTFECKSELYLDVLEFYKNGIKFSKNSKQSEDIPVGKTQKIQILDSDDDEEEDIEHKEMDDHGFKTLGDDDESDDEDKQEVGVDPRIMMLRCRKKKIPMYFSEIVETLLEGSKNEDEAEILKYIVVLKIPVLLFTGVKIDPKMCTTIARCLADMEPDANIQVPIVVAMYELFSQHPFEVADLLGDITFDRDRYALGQRLMNLNRLLQIAQLSSKQSCFNCYSKSLERHQSELLGIYPEFVTKYFISRKKLRFCQQCNSPSPTISQQNQYVEEQPDISSEESLTWRQIVDRRVAAKTRYFVTPRSKTVVSVPDEYSSRLILILWSSIANRLTSATSFYLDNEQRIRSGKMYDLFLANIFQYLGKCMLGTSGPNCPHIRNLAAHAGELITHFVQHEDANVRRSVFGLLGITLCVGEGKSFVIEALSSQGSNILKTVDSLLDAEKDNENRKLLTQIQQFLAGCTAAGMLQDVLQL